MKNDTPNMLPLTDNELIIVNGGATDGASMNMSTGADSLLSMEFKWQQGDNYRDYKLQVGNGITVNLDAFINGMHVG